MRAKVRAMKYQTIDAEIDQGRIIPIEVGCLPKHGKALVTILTEDVEPPQWKLLEPWLGKLTLTIDPVEWQRKIRAEWD